VVLGIVFVLGVDVGGAQLGVQKSGLRAVDLISDTSAIIETAGNLLDFIVGALRSPREIAVLDDEQIPLQPKLRPIVNLAEVNQEFRLNEILEPRL